VRRVVEGGSEESSILSVRLSGLRTFRRVAVGHESCSVRHVAPRDLLARVKAFALEASSFYRKLPRTPSAQVPGVQFLKSSCAVSANYHAAQRGRSRAEFIAKLGTVLEEIDESVLWLEYLRDANVASDEPVLAEAQQLRRIFGTALKTARTNSAHARH
jgi:four helix bundle protein